MAQPHPSTDHGSAPTAAADVDVDGDVELTTPAGRVRGTSDGQVIRLGGVPYARAERFGAPQPVGWDDVLDARTRGPGPPQVVAGLDLVPGMVPATTTEDCLTAEIATPDPDGRAPVLVWIPGGSFLVGGAGLPTYDGGRLAAEQGCVVVGLNYRLGALGFLAAPGVPTNLGLRDLIAGLRWLRDMAPAFGGDPERLVLVGESAGAGAIAHLLASTAELPIAGAIIQSGSPGMTLSAAQAAEVAASMPPVDVCRTSDLDALLAAQDTARQELLGRVGMMPFHPWIDDDLLPDTPVVRRNALAPVPLVIGTTRDEMALFADAVPAVPPEIATRLLARKGAALGLDPARARAALAACGDDLATAIAAVDLHVPARLLADAHAAAGHRVHRYSFTWEAPGLGAAHAIDLPFVFGTFDVDTWRSFVGADDPDAATLSASMRRAWARFAASGVPEEAWPRHEPGSSTVWELGRRVGPTDDPNQGAIAAWLDQEDPA